MANDAEILTVVRNELKMVLAEDTPGEDLDRAARAVVTALHGVGILSNTNSPLCLQDYEP